jgi:deazaflavin-dependent oxidoreductase (nitroreductase family)
VTADGDAIIGGLGKTGTFNITTSGRKTGNRRRIEIAYHIIDGRLYISGIPYPGRRGWLANLDADPALTLHVRKPAPADVVATARIIDAEPERRAVLAHIARNWGRSDIEQMVRQSPLIEVSIKPPGS